MVLSAISWYSVHNAFFTTRNLQRPWMAPLVSAIVGFTAVASAVPYLFTLQWQYRHKDDADVSMMEHRGNSVVCVALGSLMPWSFVVGTVVVFAKRRMVEKMALLAVTAIALPLCASAIAARIVNIFFSEKQDELGIPYRPHIDPI